jgi:Tfp pilus assembly PilM family ATPase
MAMLKSVVGVDLGFSTLKVVELRGTWRGFEVVKAAERRLPTDTGATCAASDSAGPERIAERPCHPTHV